MEKKKNGGSTSKSKIKPAVIEGVLSLSTVLLGAWAGASIGKPALAAGVGIAVSGLALKTAKPDMEKLGHYGMLFGLGVAVGHADIQPAETPSAVEGLAGFDGFLADATARAKAFGKGLVRRTYLDNVPAIAKATGTENGMGETPSYYGPDGSQLSMNQADALIKQLQTASVANPSQSVSGISMLDDLRGLAGTQSIFDLAA